MPLDLPPSLSHAQKDRLKHIELRLRFLGEIGRAELMQRFGMASAAASRDLALYKELAPQNIDYDGRGKRYLLGAGFTPLFTVPTGQILSWLAEQLGDTAAPTADSLLPCLMPAQLGLPNADVLAVVTRAIHFKQALQVGYHALTRGYTQREIVPFALLNTGLRWHTRAFDRKSGQFRDFVLTRIVQPVPSPTPPQAHESAEQDVQWGRIVALDLVPHPDRPYPETTCLDFGMRNGVMCLQLRAALAGYVLRKYSVDCSADHHLTGPEYCLWLKDPLALYGVESAQVAPGYQAPQLS